MAPSGTTASALSACDIATGLGEDVSAVGEATHGALEKTSEAIDAKTTTP